MSPSDFLHFQVPKQFFSGHKFRDDDEVETAELRWLVTQGTDFCYRGMVRLLLPCDERHSCGGAYTKPRRAVQLNPNISYWRKNEEPKIHSKSIYFLTDPHTPQQENCPLAMQAQEPCFIIIIIIIIFLLHGLDRLTCSGIDALPSFPGASTIRGCASLLMSTLFSLEGYQPICKTPILGGPVCLS